MPFCHMNCEGQIGIDLRIQSGLASVWQIVFCRKVDLIVEVAHPCITNEFGERFLEHADYMVITVTSIYNYEFSE